MNDLPRHIEVLLLTNDCVVVPGLGGFVAHHVCARYDKADGLFLPPGRTLGFNPQLTMNDSLLVQSYMEAYDMSYPEALRSVEGDVEEMRNQLFNNGEYDMKGIGKLSVDSGKTMMFEPCMAGVLTPSLYALNYLEFPLRPRVAMVDATDATDAIEESPKARIIYIDKDAQSGKSMLNIRVSALRQAAVAAMIALVFMLTLNADFTSSKHADKYQSGIFSFLYNSKNDAQENVVAKKLPPKANAMTEAEKTQNAPSHYWTVVLCSHVSNKNAEWFRENLQKDGIQSTVLSGDNANAKVIYGRYSTKDDAYDALREMKDNKHFVQGWVMLVE